MKRFDRLEHPRRYILLKALAAIAFVSLAAIAFVCTTPAELQLGQSTDCATGQVPASSQATAFKTPIKTSGGVEPANKAETVFAAVKGEFNLRPSSVTTEPPFSALTAALRLVTGALEKVGPARIVVVTATIGIRN
jgi:hypothetical protein